MKIHYGQLALALIFLVGFIAWIWKLNHGMPLTFTTGFLTAGTAAGILVFSSGVVEKK